MRRKPLNPLVFDYNNIRDLMGTSGDSRIAEPIMDSNINEAKPVPGDEFPAVLDSKRHCVMFTFVVQS